MTTISSLLSTFITFSCICYAQTDDSSGTSSLRPPVSESILNQFGLENSRCTHTEAFLDVNKAPDEKAAVSTDGPTFTCSVDISKKVLPTSIQDSVSIGATTTVMTNELLNLDGSKFNAPVAHGEVNWGRLMREYYITVDFDSKSGNAFALLVKRAAIGVQDLDYNNFDSAMPLPDNGALRGLTRERSAKAIRIDLNNSMLDSLSVAIFKTGTYHPEGYGDTPQPFSPGASVMFTKNFYDRLRVSGAITKINYPDLKEIRINTGIAYANAEAGLTIFWNGVRFKGSPLYESPNWSMAHTVGIIKAINSKYSLTAEKTRTSDGMHDETAVGLTRQLSKTTSFGCEVRRKQDGTYYGCRLSRVTDAGGAR